MTAAHSSLNLPRCFSAGYEPDGKTNMVQTIRHTRSLPATFSTVRPLRQIKRAITGAVTVKPPTSLAVYIARSPEDPILGRPQHNASTRVPSYGIPMQRSGWRASGPGEQMAPRAYPTPDIPIHHHLGISNRVVRAGHSYPTIVLILAVTEDDERRGVGRNSENDTSAYPYRPPGLPVLTRPPISRSHTMTAQASLTPDTRRSTRPSEGPIHSASHLSEYCDLLELVHERASIGDQGGNTGTGPAVTPTTSSTSTPCSR